MRRVLALLLTLHLAAAVAAPPTDRVRAAGVSLQLPEGWVAERGVMGLDLVARPPRERDVTGWGEDLITLRRDSVDPGRTCLEGYTYRTLEQLAHNADPFRRLSQEELSVAGRPATLLTLRYTEGPRERMAYVLLVADGRHMLMLTAQSSPARFESQRAVWRHALESLRLR